MDPAPPALRVDRGWAERIDWARRQGVVVWSPDPYEQLATYYSSIGDEDSARRVKIARNRDEPCGQAYACFDPWVYGADVVLPIIDFGQDSTWRPTETNDAGTLWPRVRWALIAVGWVLASVFVAAFTKLVEHG